VPIERRIEAGEIHEKFWERTVREAFKNDPLRIAIELIKNAADSYTRLEKRGNLNPPYEIIVKLYFQKRKPPFIVVLDNAEGMDSKKLREALKYGTQTSMGEDIEAVTSAEKGIGLKDAMMALEKNWLITVKDSLINERNKHLNFATGIGKEDEPISEKERKTLGIANNGTLIRGRFPDYFRERRFSTFCEHLQKHFLIRKLLENPKFKIIIVDAKSNVKISLKYNPPKIEEQILDKLLEINYNNRKYTVHLTIYKSVKELKQGKPFGESGLIFYYGDYTVVDFTFCRLERNLSFSKCFGEVKMEVEALIRDPNEAPLVDEKRRGLDSEHPFNKILFDELNKILKEIEEKEEPSKYSLDESTKKEILRELNKIYKEIKGTGLFQPPIKPMTFAFYPVYVSMKEFEPKTISLIINSSIVEDNFEISLQSTNPDIQIKRPKKIRIEEKPRENFLVKHIVLYSEKAGAKGEIIASRWPYSLESEKMGVEVLENPIFSPTDGFAFVPDKTTIIDGGTKKVELCIEKGIIKKHRRIALSSSYPVNCPGEWLLPEKKENLQKYAVKNIVKVELPIKVKETGHIGDKAIIKASYGDKRSNLKVTIVSEPSIAGLFRDIRPSAKVTEPICAFLHDQGILEIYYKHPLIKRYMVKNFRKRSSFLVFIADTITREVIRAFVETAVKENLSTFPILDMDRPESEIEDHIVREYYIKGPKMHDMFVHLAKTFKIGKEG